MSKKQMIRRRGLSAFLAMAMCFGLLPATAWAAEEGVAIDESNFPNKTFRNYIQYRKCLIRTITTFSARMRLLP